MKIVMPALLVAALAGCASSHLGTAGLMVPARFERPDGGRRGEGRDCLWFGPLGIRFPSDRMNPSLDEAAQRALEGTGANALAGVTLRYERLADSMGIVGLFGLLFDRRCAIVEGEPITVPGGVTQLDTSGRHGATSAARHASSLD